MIVVGLTGGVASGKSFVARCFEELGAGRIDADQVAHDILKDASVISQVTDRWGDRLLETNGNINRKRLGKIVFGAPDDSELDHLESIMHPKIRLRIREQMKRLRDSAAVELLVLDIPLLFEGGYDQHCDYVIFVDANFAIRQQRAKNRGWPDDELAKRESRQLPVEDKKLRSDVVIDNSGSKESTAKQLAEFCQRFDWAIPKSYSELYLDSRDNDNSKSNLPDGSR
jgi:dephospho-CoA kinase